MAEGGVGARAARVRAVAKRAGIPVQGHEVPFRTRLKASMRPNKPTLHLRERTPYDFTVTWHAPRDIDCNGDGNADHVTHYSLELATTAPAGTYYPWRELWCGAGHAAPDFCAHAASKSADGSKEASPAKTPSPG